MTTQQLGDLISIVYIVILVFICLIIVLILTTGDTYDQYKYCHNCKYGMCFEDPKSDRCMQWKDDQKELANKKESNHKGDNDTE